METSNRLMVIYRKLNLYQKEAVVITKSISALENSVELSQTEWIKTHKIAADLTRLLAQSLGLLSSKGLPLYKDELLEKCRRRKAVVIAKLGNAGLDKKRKKIIRKV